MTYPLSKFEVYIFFIGVHVRFGCGKWKEYVTTMKDYRIILYWRGRWGRWAKPSLISLKSNYGPWQIARKFEYLHQNIRWIIFADFLGLLLTNFLLTSHLNRREVSHSTYFTLPNLFKAYYWHIICSQAIWIGGRWVILPILPYLTFLGLFLTIFSACEPFENVSHYTHFILPNLMRRSEIMNQWIKNSHSVNENFRTMCLEIWIHFLTICKNLNHWSGKKSAFKISHLKVIFCQEFPGWWDSNDLKSWGKLHWLKLSYSHGENFSLSQASFYSAKGWRGHIFDPIQSFKWSCILRAKDHVFVEFNSLTSNSFRAMWYRPIPRCQVSDNNIGSCKGNYRNFL